MYVCLYIRAYTCTYLYVCMYVCVIAGMYLSMHICIDVIHPFVRVDGYIYTFPYVWVSQISCPPLPPPPSHPYKQDFKAGGRAESFAEGATGCEPGARDGGCRGAGRRGVRAGVQVHCAAGQGGAAGASGDHRAPLVLLVLPLGRCQSYSCVDVSWICRMVMSYGC